MEFLPDLEFRHKRQTLRMEGPNLAEKRCRQILTRAPETPLTKIRKIDNLHFEAQSSRSDRSYQIDLDTTTCNCSDFPRIQLCKHIAAIVLFLGEPISDPNHLAQATWSRLIHQSSRTVASAVQMTAPLLLSFRQPMILLACLMSSFRKRCVIQKWLNH
jgi:hypothetical protein